MRLRICDKRFAMDDLRSLRLTISNILVLEPGYEVIYWVILAVTKIYIIFFGITRFAVGATSGVWNKILAGKCSRVKREGI